MLVRIACIAGVMLASGCDRREDRAVFDGIQFRANTSADSKEDRRFFTTGVQRAAQSLDGAREAGRYDAIKYCIANYGTSRIAWTDGPDAEEGALTISDGTLVLRGKCLG